MLHAFIQAGPLDVEEEDLPEFIKDVVALGLPVRVMIDDMPKDIEVFRQTVHAAMAAGFASGYVVGLASTIDSLATKPKLLQDLGYLLFSFAVNQLDRRAHAAQGTDVPAAGGR